MSAAGFPAVSCDRVELTSTAESAGGMAAAFAKGTPLRSEIEERAATREREPLAGRTTPKVSAAAGSLVKSPLVHHFGWLAV
ncbi:hypothetical protein SB748_28415 [Rhizobium sp. SIMBA_035]